VLGVIDFAGIGQLLTGVGILLTAIISARTHKAVAEVRTEVQTINGRSLAQLADATEGRRIEADVAIADRTESDQHYVDHLNEKPKP